MIDFTDNLVVVTKHTGDMELYGSETMYAIKAGLRMGKLDLEQMVQ